MKATLHVDDAVGERRRLLTDERGAAIRLELERWSERETRARTDEIWFARAGAKIPGGRGWHVRMGAGPDGLLETTSTALHEGQLISVRIKAEARAGKGPLLSLHALPADVMTGAEPGRHAAAAADPFLSGVEVAGTIDGLDGRQAIDGAIEEALSREIPIPGGGSLTIERTAALTAIDVDSGARTAGGRQDATSALNSAAAREAARQISLRGLAGLFVVDFVTMREAAARREIADTFRQDLRTLLARRCDVLEISPLGLCEASVARRGRGVVESLVETPPDEREALTVLRALEEEGISRRGRRIRARVLEAAHAWLVRDPIGWRQALSDRIGERWSLEVAADAASRWQVWSEE